MFCTCCSLSFIHIDSVHCCTNLGWPITKDTVNNNNNNNNKKKKKKKKKKNI